MGLLSSIVIESGTVDRTITLAHTDGELTSITDIDGSVRLFDYDVDHRLLSVAIDDTPYLQAWGYTEGLLTSMVFGSGAEEAEYLIESQSQLGLDEPAAGFPCCGCWKKREPTSETPPAPPSSSEY